MSLRAQFNFIGLSGVAALSAQQYLMETYRFGTWVISVLAPTAAVCLLILSVIPRRLRSRVAGLSSSARFRHWVVPVITFGLLGFGLRMLQLLSRYGTDVAIGPLRPYPVDRGAGQRFCGLSLICITSAWLLVHHLSRKVSTDRTDQALLKGLSFLLVVVTL